MKKLLMLLFVNVAWGIPGFSQYKMMPFVENDSTITFIDKDTQWIQNKTTYMMVAIPIKRDTFMASLLVTHNRRGIAHPHDGFVLTENGIVTGEYLDVNKKPIKKPYTVWSYQLGVVHTPRKYPRVSLCH